MIAINIPVINRDIAFVYNMMADGLVYALEAAW
jgi:hypothetical protein